MLYSSVKELSGSAYWDTARLENAFSVWVARYPAEPYPKTAHPDYSGKYDIPITAPLRELRAMWICR